MADFAVSGKPLTQEGLESSSLNAMRLDVAEVWAVISVETTGCGFLIDRRPKILFERHVLSRLTGGRYDADDPDISASTAGGYGASGAHQYNRLAAADAQLSAMAAFLKSNNLDLFLRTHDWPHFARENYSQGAAHFCCYRKLKESFIEADLPLSLRLRQTTVS